MKPRFWLVLLAVIMAAMLAGAAIAADDEDQPAPKSKKARPAAAQPAEEVGDEEAAEPREPTAEEKIKKWAELGNGVFNEKFDSQGRLQQCIVVGQAEITTVLGAGHGKQVARQQADQRARAEFVKWVKTEASIHESTEGETTILKEGVEADEETLKTVGKAISKTSAKLDQAAKGLVRGLTLVGVDIDPKDQTYTIVYGWSLKRSNAAKHVGKSEKSDEPTPLESADSADETAKDAKAKLREKKKIRKKSAVSGSADEFLK